MDISQILKTIENYLPEDQIHETRNYYTMPTICHNADYKEASRKLYLYKNEGETPLFHCYTECSETFNVYQMVMKAEEVRGNTISFREAYKMVHGREYQKEESEITTQEKIVLQTEFKNPLTIRLNEYSEGILDLFSINETHPWRLEGIDPLHLSEFKAGYSRSFQGVVIPHFDWRGRLVGVRIRTYDKNKVDYAKYMPLHANNTFYAHPLSLNLYGIWENGGAIRQAKTVYLFEGEKSVLQFRDMFNSKLGLAVCGSSISEWQINMLIHYLGVEKVVIAFDKEYTKHSEAFEHVEKIKKKTAHLQLFANVSVLIDDENRFDLKDSPTDKTVQDFNAMREWHI